MNSSSTSPDSRAHNRVVLLRNFGGPEVIEVAEARIPTPGPGEVCVRVLASGLEYTDVVIRRHLYPGGLPAEAERHLTADAL